MQEQVLFSKLSSNLKVDLCAYINAYIEEYPDTDIMIGCDSQNYAESTIYAVVVALYKKGKGAHLLYRRWKTTKEYTRSTRLLKEVWHAIETAELMRGSGLPKPIWIDVDLNPDQRYKSNEIFRQAVCMVEGMGYRVRYKSMDPMVTYAADHLIKT